MILKIFTIAALVALAFADLPPNYQNLTAGQKQDILWSKILENPYPDDKLPNGNLSPVQLLMPSYDEKSFTHDGDEMIPGRTKLIHTYGSAGKVELQIFPNSSYTGLFKAGSTNIGIARLSLALQDDNNFTPGMAVKILINGKPSINLIAMFSVNGQGKNKNFFEKVFTNYIPPAQGIVLKALAIAFREAIRMLPGDQCDKPLDEGKLPLYTPASVDSNGTVNANPKAPSVINFHPNPAIAWDPNTKNDVRINLANVPVGSVLYTVAVKLQENSPEEVIGQLVLRSKFVASEYEDKNLYFQHSSKSSKC
jgi:hypothetical protein